MTDIRLVVFDLGGVLVRAARTFDEAYAWAGLPASEALQTPEFIAAQASAVFDFGTGRITAEEYYARIEAASGGTCDQAAAAAVVQAWCAEELPGVGAVLDALEAAGVPAVCLSNTNPLHWERMTARSGAPPDYPAVVRLHHHFVSHLLGLGKPDPAIFEAVTSTMGVARDEVLYFDDVIEYVEVARTLGWNAEQIDHTRDTVPQLLGHLRRHGVIGQG